MQISEGWAIFLVGQATVLGAFVWKTASAYGELKYRDRVNQKDIDGLGQKSRRFEALTFQRLDALESFLIEKARYLPPSLHYFEEGSDEHNRD